MRRADLWRFDKGDQGTFGVIITPGLRLFTGELPWRDNRPGVSCIPATWRGLVTWTWSPRFKRFTYELQGVPQRLGIRKHGANYCGDVSLGYRSHLNGCIALGEKLGWMDGQKCVLLSTAACMRFEQHLNRESFELVIHDV